MKKTAPIALFVYNRPQHTLRTLEALAVNDLASESELHIFSDGPKPHASDVDRKAIDEVRNIVLKRNWCGKVELHFSEENKGLYRSITEGIELVLSKDDNIIVVEDDILTSPDFLRFCNEVLEKYKDEEKVWLASGYMFPIGHEKKLPSTFFLPTLSCWGWCTWKRAWKNFNPDAEGMLRAIDRQRTRNRFDLNSSYPYYEMLKQRAENKNQSWDVCWYASFFLGNGLCLYPGTTLVDNIGMDGSGTHWTGAGWKTRRLTDKKNNLWTFPPQVVADHSVQKQLEIMLKGEYNPDFLHRILRKLKRLSSHVNYR